MVSALAGFVLNGSGTASFSLGDVVLSGAAGTVSGALHLEFDSSLVREASIDDFFGGGLATSTFSLDLEVSGFAAGTGSVLRSRQDVPFAGPQDLDSQTGLFAGYDFGPITIDVPFSLVAVG